MRRKAIGSPRATSPNRRRFLLPAPVSRLRARRRWTVAPSILLIFVLALSCSSAAAAPNSTGAVTPVQTDHFTFAIQASSQDASAFTETYGPIAERSLSQLATIFGAQPPGKITVVVYADEASFNTAANASGRTEPQAEDAFAIPSQMTILMPLPQFKALSSIEAENTIRHAVAHILAMVASKNNVPQGFGEGIAEYVETPVTARIARMAATVQIASQQGSLLSWSELNRDNAPTGSPDLTAAEDYAIADFLLDHYGVHTFRNFLTALANRPDWRSAMRAAYQESPDDMERQWQQNLANWTAGGWQDNVLAALDLQPARDYLAKANYQAAKALLQQSQRLYTDIGDQTGLADVSRLLALCDTGIQAESLMTQTQEALQQHTYDRAQSLLTQARNQYDQLPADQRPTDLLTSYNRLAAQGMTATNQLAQARQQARHWSDYQSARSSALAAGTTFAQLGDKDMAQQANSLLRDLDTRARRLVYLLGGLAALTISWLILWLWTREPSTIDWS